jgi:dihydropteroate synthase
MLNDVSAGREDPGMLELAAEAGAPIVLMHMQGEPATMQADPKYQDVVGEVEAFLLGRVEAALAAGVPGRQILLDPGIGFGKTLEHNLALLKNLDRFVASGFPVLLGASRKRFIGQIATRCGWDAPPAAERVGGTCATTAMGIAAGVRWFRVHDVGDNRQAADVSLAIHLERSA